MPQRQKPNKHNTTEKLPKEWRQCRDDLCRRGDCTIPRESVPIDAFRPLSFHLQLALAGADHLRALGTMSLL